MISFDLFSDLALSGAKSVWVLRRRAPIGGFPHPKSAFGFLW
jgi:hypothetical protein